MREVIGGTMTRKEGNTEIPYPAPRTPPTSKNNFSDFNGVSV
jgi:hypothetical protein